MPVVGLCADSDAIRICETAIDVPATAIFEPLVANDALQLFDYHIANRKDRAINKSRNLAKSVTVEWLPRSRMRDVRAPTLFYERQRDKQRGSFDGRDRQDVSLLRLRHPRP